METGLHVWWYVLEAKRACDEHVFVRPGTDVALALAMMKVIHDEGLVDHEHVRDFTVGYEPFAERLRSLALADMSHACDVPVETLQYLARTFARTRPAARSGWA